MALVVARYLPGPLSGTVPAQPRELAALRRRVATWAAAVGLPPDLLDHLQLTLGEAAANAVDHAYPEDPGDFIYHIATTTGGVHVTVRDRGRWRPEPTDKGFRGRGLQIIRALAERTSIDRDDTGTSIEFHLTAPPGATPAQPSPPPAASAQPPVGTLFVENDPDAPVQVLRLVGDLDAHTVEGVREAVLDRIRSADQRPIDIDLSDVRYLSSSGIALLLHAAVTAARAGRPLTVLAVESTAPARVLHLSGLHGLTDNTLAVRIRQR